MSKQSFQLKQKAWTFRNTYEIKNDSGGVAYRIKAKAFSVSKKFNFEDEDGHQLLLIKKRFIGFKPQYKIIRDGEVVAKVEKKWSVWKSKFRVDLPGPNDLIVEGKFWKREYKFERKGRKIAEVSKRFWSWADTYGVEIDEGEDVVLILATVICIDLFLKDLESEADAADTGE